MAQTAGTRFGPRVVSWPRIALGLVGLLLAAALLADTAVAEPRILRVPQDFDTVQAAVDASQSGDLVLVDRGTYPGDVFVSEDHAGITIRGVDRNDVVLDGEDERVMGIEVHADDVTLENMTAHNYQGNGFYWQSVDGFLGRYLTAWNLGGYGIYAFDSINGVFEDSYASGGADSGFYIGQCNPCNTTLRRVVAEHSALGYSGTNAGGDLVLEDSRWQRNGAGILPNSLDSEANPPQQAATIRNNTVTDNNNENTPAVGLAGSILGVGIGIAGGVDNVVEGNTITDHDKYGIAVFPLPDQTVWVPSGNTVTGNDLSGSGMADLALSQGSGEDNCFSDNTLGSPVATDPPALQETHPCDGAGLAVLPAGGGSATVTAVLAADFAQAQAGLAERPSYTQMPAPPAQDTMPDAVRTPAPDGAPSDDAGDPGPSLPTTGGGALLALVGAGLVTSGIRLRRR